MANLDRSVIYTYKLESNITAEASGVSAKAEEADAKVKTLKTSEDTLKQSTDSATGSLTNQQKQLMVQVTALMAVKQSVSAVTNGLISMGLVSGEDAKKLQLLNAGFQTLCGFATGLKALMLINETFNLSLLKTAILNTFNSILESPWKLALVGAGMGAAVGVAAAYGMSGGGGGGTTNNTQIIIEDSSGGKAATANGINATISGGRIL